MLQNAWVESLMTPIDANGIGVDPRASEEFFALKEEVNKTSGVDYQLIREKSETILQQGGKDLRVLSYLLVARLNLDGFSGLVEGLSLFADLIEKYGDDLYPQKLNSKLASIKWLNEPRINHLIQQKLDLNNAKIAGKILKRLAAVNKQLQNIEGQPTLFPKLQAILHTKKEAAPSSQTKTESTLQPIQLQTAANDNHTSGKCTTEAELRDMTKMQINYLREESQWLRAIAYARAFRWANLQDLHSEDNATTIPAPSEDALINFNNMLGQASALTILKSAEDLFMMQGGLYYFDLHYHASVAAKNAGFQDVAAYIEDELKLLLLRFPKLINLSFANGTPFVSVQYRPWLENLIKPLSNSHVISQDEAEALNLTDKINRYRALVAGKALNEKIDLIQEMPAHNLREQFIQKLALARFCQEEKRADIAIPILEQLVDAVETHALATWEPEFALFVWSELRAALKLRMPKMDKEQQKHVMHKLEGLFASICITDIGRALKVKT